MNPRKPGGRSPAARTPDAWRRLPAAASADDAYDVVVESCERTKSHAWLRIGETRLAAKRWDGIRRGERVRVRVRPEDVVLCLGHPGRVSTRNVLPGHVRSTRFVPEGVLVALDVGFPLSALITRGALLELGLRRGTAVFALVKATSVTPDVRVCATVRVSLVGRRGVVGHDRIDLLRAIARTGSLTAAARSVGVTYRTAWTWTREMNRVWSAPLVAPTTGGKDGGGAALTPEGVAALRLAARIEEGAVR